MTNGFVETEEQQALRKAVAGMAANYGQDYYLEKARTGQHTDELWTEAGKLGIEHMLCVSVSLERFTPMMELIEPYTQISASVGVHPDGTNVEDPDEGHGAHEEDQECREDVV